MAVAETAVFMVCDVVLILLGCVDIHRAFQRSYELSIHKKVPPDVVRLHRRRRHQRRHHRHAMGVRNPIRADTTNRSPGVNLVQFIGTGVNLNPRVLRPVAQARVSLPAVAHPPRNPPLERQIRASSLPANRTVYPSGTPPCNRTVVMRSATRRKHHHHHHRRKHEDLALLSIKAHSRWTHRDQSEKFHPALVFDMRHMLDELDHTVRLVRRKRPYAQKPFVPVTGQDPHHHPRESLNGRMRASDEEEAEEEEEEEEEEEDEENGENSDDPSSPSGVSDSTGAGKDDPEAHDLVLSGPRRASHYCSRMSRNLVSLPREPSSNRESPDVPAWPEPEANHLSRPGSRTGIITLSPLSPRPLGSPVHSNLHNLSTNPVPLVPMVKTLDRCMTPSHGSPVRSLQTGLFQRHLAGLRRLAGSKGTPGLLPIVLVVSVMVLLRFIDLVWIVAGWFHTTDWAAVHHGSAASWALTHVAVCYSITISDPRRLQKEDYHSLRFRWLCLVAFGSGVVFSLALPLQVYLLQSNALPPGTGRWGITDGVLLGLTTVQVAVNVALAPRLLVNSVRFMQLTSALQTNLSRHMHAHQRKPRPPRAARRVDPHHDTSQPEPTTIVPQKSPSDLVPAVSFHRERVPTYTRPSASATPKRSSSLPPTGQGISPSVSGLATVQVSWSARAEHFLCHRRVRSKLRRSCQSLVVVSSLINLGWLWLVLTLVWNLWQGYHEGVLWHTPRLVRPLLNLTAVGVHCLVLFQMWIPIGSNHAGRV
jgi:hypothetical protein